MIINPALAEVIRKTWITDQNHPYRDRSKRLIPDQSDFELLLDVLFRASLISEENKEISASVAWVTPKEFVELEIPKRRETPLILKFSSPLELEPKTIGKLNQVSDGKTSTFLAGKIDGQAKVWGICYFNKLLGNLEEIPYGIEEARHFSPDCLTVTITGIGSLLISMESCVIGRIETGEFRAAEPTPFTSKGLGPFLYNLIGASLGNENDNFASQCDANIATAFISSIKFLIDSLDKKRAGATIIFVSDSHHESIWDKASTAWPCSGDLEIKKLTEKRQEFIDKKKGSSSNFNNNTPFVIKSDMVLRQRLENLACLAQADGALILTPSFVPLGFGVKLSAEKWKGKFEHGNTIYNDPSQTLLDFTRLGTRHNSAANFVGAIPGAVAFVASSDGPIRALARADDDRIVYWPDCRISMFTN
jgi:hypothetical protein